MSDPIVATTELSALGVALIAGGASILVAVVTSIANYFISTNNLKIPKKTELLHHEITEMHAVLRNIRQIKSDLTLGKTVPSGIRTFDGVTGRGSKLVRDDIGQSKTRAMRLFEGKKYLLNPQDSAKIVVDLATTPSNQDEWIKVLDAMHAGFELSINSHRRKLGVIK